MKLPSGLRALHHRNFRLFFVGQGCSQIGFWLQMIATSWLVFKLSGSTFLLGLAAFALQIPFLVMTPLAGVVIDRADPRRILMLTNSIAALQAAAMFLLVRFGHVQPWHLVLANLVLGLVNACDAPGRQSILIHLVGGKADLPNALALNSSMMNGARVVGPVLAGTLIAAFGERWGFGLNVFTYLGMVFALSRMRLAPATRRAPEASLLAQLAAGARYAYGFLPSRCALLLLTATSLSVNCYVALLPWFAREAFAGDSSVLGLMLSAAGFGAVSGMVYLAGRPGIRGLFRLLGWTAALAGAALVVFSFSRSLALALPALYFIGMGLMLTAASTNTVLQSIVPDELRGRVASLYVMSFLGMSPVGSFLAGWASEHFGPPATLAVCGGLALAAAAVYYSRIPAIRVQIRPVYERLGVYDPAH